MVIDKTGIMSILRTSEEDLKNHIGEDSILITTIYDDFSIEQIGNDSIDLRINNKGYILSNDYQFVNTLSDENFEKYFEEVQLNAETGYDLKPGALLFVDTLERINLVGDLIGRISGRSTFSRFGLSVHCTQEKFSKHLVLLRMSISLFIKSYLQGFMDMPENLEIIISQKKSGC